MPGDPNPMPPPASAAVGVRLEGTVTRWDDERGFGRIESRHGGEPIFVHISAWPRLASRPTVGQMVTFEIELGPKGKRARNVLNVVRHGARPMSERAAVAQWGTATVFAIPAFLALFLIVATLWNPPRWVTGLYLVTSAVTFLAYAADKSAARRRTWRTPESTLHVLAILGGWPGALLAQQVLRHKSTKRAFRRVFWATTLLNAIAFVALTSPIRQVVLAAP